ncbi:hypothetical protein RRG08_019294 [Elysia crispata]|uniref:C-type lectin domain-containing protein n=1 Tax=Elysia crispata TaxID=231223 RepID=A0AAE0YMN7_9GAST|nr:hypothetical protein RRG08_019294 [Elysia crispata]
MKPVTVCLLFLATLAFGKKVTVENSCPSGAVAELGPKPFRIYNDVFCFLFTTTSQAVYADAEKACSAHNGTLAMPKTNAINLFLEKSIDELGIDEPLWVGIDDRKTEGQFVYADGTKVDWDNFNLFTNPAFQWFQDCVAIDNRYGLWNRYRCTNTLVTNAYRPFICQYEIEKK